jgi:hypothetical protein
MRSSALLSAKVWGLVLIDGPNSTGARSLDGKGGNAQGDGGLTPDRAVMGRAHGRERARED